MYFVQSVPIKLLIPSLIKFFIPQMQSLFESSVHLKVACNKELLPALLFQ